jgi:hypothetical protein
MTWASEKIIDIDKLIEHMDKLAAATSCLCEQSKNIQVHLAQLETFLPWAIGAVALLGLGLWRFSQK